MHYNAYNSNHPKIIKQEIIRLPVPTMILAIPITTTYIWHSICIFIGRAFSPAQIKVEQVANL